MLARNAEPRRRQAGLLAEWLAVGLLLSLLLVGLVVSGAVRRFDHVLYDQALTARPPPPPADILVIAIDEASLRALGPWPWSRAVHADAIARLRTAGARAIGYDVLFTEPRDGDAVLAAALAGPVPVVLPLQFRVPGVDGRGYDLVPPVVGGARVGHAGVRPDEDGVVRTLDLALDGAQRWPHMAALLAGMPPGLPPFVPRPDDAELLRQGERLVGFRGPPGRFPTVSFAALHAGEVPAEVLRGKIVVVGATAAGLGDQFATPSARSGGVMSGVELQANFVADLIQRRDLRRAAPVWSVALGLVALWLGMAALLRLRPTAAALVGVALLVAVAAAAVLALRVGGLWVGPAAALAVVALSQPIWAWRRLAVVNRWMMAELAELGGPVGASVTAADPVTRTTALLAATIDRLDELRELADAAVRGLPDATLLVDRDGAIVGANAAAEAWLGPAPALARVDAMFRDLPRFGAAAFAAADPAWRGEHVARDGSIRDIRFTPWRDREGAALGWIVRFADISALRRAETAREEALQLLTHDMRGPQATILALLDRHPDLDPDLAARLRQLAQRTIGLADGYLQLARADAGDHAMIEIDLAAVAIEAIDELWPQSQARGIRVIGAGLEKEALVNGNHSLLLRAVVNLVGNAVKFGPAGSAVTVDLARDGGAWRLRVADAGPGLSAAAQARLFGRFRTGLSAGGGSDGVGLGLAFVRAVAEGHGGTIGCTSTEGVGSVFTLAVPAIG